MLIIINGEYLNPTAIARISETDKESVIHLTNGDEVKTAMSPDAIAIETGAVISANSGFDAAWIMIDGKVDREPVTAWLVHGVEESMVPMVPSGRLYPDAVIYPDSRVQDRETDHFHVDIDTLIATRIEAAERAAKSKTVAD